MRRSETFALGILVGAGIVYFLDPDKGARRRALMRDRFSHARHELDVTARSGARHTRNRMSGIAHEVRARMTEGRVDDRVLSERVRSAIGRKVSQPGEIDVAAQDGIVTLTGVVPPSEVQELVRAARAVRGVERIDNRLHVHATEDGAGAGTERRRL